MYSSSFDDSIVNLILEVVLLSMDHSERVLDSSLNQILRGEDLVQLLADRLVLEAKLLGSLVDELLEVAKALVHDVWAVFLAPVLLEHNASILGHVNQPLKQHVSLVVERGFVEEAVGLLLLQDTVVVLGDDGNEEVEHHNQHEGGLEEPGEPNQEDVDVPGHSGGLLQQFGVDWHSKLSNRGSEGL